MRGQNSTKPPRRRPNELRKQNNLHGKSIEKTDGYVQTKRGIQRIEPKIKMTKKQRRKERRMNERN